MVAAAVLVLLRSYLSICLSIIIIISSSINIIIITLNHIHFKFHIPTIPNNCYDYNTILVA